MDNLVTLETVTGESTEDEAPAAKEAVTEATLDETTQAGEEQMVSRFFSSHFFLFGR